MSADMESVEQFRPRARAWIKANLGPIQPADISQNCENDGQGRSGTGRSHVAYSHSG